jgi:hypothetical protein
MANIVVAKPPPEPPALNNCEIWMEGPEPYATKIVDVTETPQLVQNFALDQWYDFYARAPSNATGDAGVGVLTLDIPGFPQPNNPEPYHIWVAWPGMSPTRNRFGLEGLSAGPIAAGQTQYMGSMRFTSPTNTTQPPNPVPVPPGGGGGGLGGEDGGIILCYTASTSTVVVVDPLSEVIVMRLTVYIILQLFFRIYSF